MHEWSWFKLIRNIANEYNSNSARKNEISLARHLRTWLHFYEICPASAANISSLSSISRTEANWVLPYILHSKLLLLPFSIPRTALSFLDYSGKESWYIWSNSRLTIERFSNKLLHFRLFRHDATVLSIKRISNLSTYVSFKIVVRVRAEMM